MGGGQPLGSPGSCLETFYFNPYIECNNRGECYYFHDKHSYWLARIDANSDVEPVSQTMKAGSHIQRISRCKVCMMLPQ